MAKTLKPGLHLYKVFLTSCVFGRFASFLLTASYICSNLLVTRLAVMVVVTQVHHIWVTYISMPNGIHISSAAVMDGTIAKLGTLCQSLPLKSPWPVWQNGMCINVVRIIFLMRLNL